MRIYYLLIPLLLMGACKSADMKNTTAKTTLAKKGACPEEGTCNVIVHKNSTLSILTDDTGAVYPEIGFGKDLVVEFAYTVKGPEGTADGNYSETIHFLVPSSVKTLSLKDKGLSEVQMVWGKHCFCKGEAGYYPVQKGSLKVNKTDKEITFDVTVKVDGRDQVISHIIRTAKI